MLHETAILDVYDLEEARLSAKAFGCTGLLWAPAGPTGHPLIQFVGEPAALRDLLDAMGFEDEGTTRAF